jgi:hypothetical protein
MADLRNQKRGRSVSDRRAEAQDETGRNKHLKVDGRRLEHNGQDHDQGTDADTPSTAKTIGNVGSDWQSEERTEEHDTGEKTLDGARRVVHV